MRLHAGPCRGKFRCSPTVTVNLDRCRTRAGHEGVELLFRGSTTAGPPGGARRCLAAAGGAAWERLKELAHCPEKVMQRRGPAPPGRRPGRA